MVTKAVIHIMLTYLFVIFLELTQHSLLLVFLCLSLIPISPHGFVVGSVVILERTFLFPDS